MLRHSVKILPHKIVEGRGLLQMRLFWEGGRLSLNLGYGIDVAKWDKETQRCIRNTTHGKKSIAAAEINRKINEWEDAAEAAFDAIGRNDTATPAEIKSKIYNYLGLATDNYVIKAEGTTMVDVINEFLRIESVRRGLVDRSKRNYASLRHDFTHYKGGAICIEKFDKDEFADYYNYLLECDKAGKTISTRLKILKSLLHWAEKSGYNVPNNWKDYKPKVALLPKTIVYLTWNELIQVYNFACNTDKLREKQKDVTFMFLLSCFSGLRLSDLRNLRKSDIHNDCINVTTIKTNATISINLNDYSRSIIDRYMGTDNKDGRLFPPHSNTYNTYKETLATVLRNAGITDKVTLTYYKGGVRHEDIVPKCDCITMHCGRRTFITNAISMGIPPNVVMQWTGHSDYAAMLPYIAITSQAKRDAMALFDKK